MPSWEPSEQVDRSSARQSWESITFLHLGYEPDAIARLLPESVVPDTYDGLAWVGITPFRLHASVLPAAPGPRVALVEVNVRTYVRDRGSGRDGIWFLSLEIDQPAVSAALRSVLALPYRWSATSMQDEGTELRYGVRRHPPHRQGSFEMRVNVGEPLDEPGEFETYLVGRWRAFTERAGMRLSIPVEHPPWQLMQAQLADWRPDCFLESLDLPEPVTEPHVLFSPGVEVKLGIPRPGR